MFYLNNHTLGILRMSTLSALVEGKADRIEKRLTNNKGVLPSLGHMLAGIVMCASFSQHVMAGNVSPKVAENGAHCVALRADGTVWTWGNNNSSQLGDGTSGGYKEVPALIDLPDVRDVSAGTDFTVAVKQDGTVWAWGYNDEYGLLGDGSVNTERNRPVKVKKLTKITQVSCGNTHTIALKEDGTVWAWGLNNQGQLGDGTSAWKSSYPVMLKSLSGVKSIVAGARHNFALKYDGTVWAWGSNKYGELGDGTTTDKEAPVLLTELTEVKAIAAASNHTVAVKNDGTVWTWGNNHYGQLGDGTTVSRNTPQMVQGLTGAISVSTNCSHTVVLLGDGTLAAFGSNDSGELGNGSTISSTVPVTVKLSDVKSVFSGSYAIKKDGTLWSWGGNAFGQLGNGSITPSSVPVQSGMPNMDMMTENVETSAFKIKNRWTGEYLYDAGSNVEYGSTASNDAFYWEISNIDDTYKQIQNKSTRQYMNIENQTGVVQCDMDNATGMWSSMWQFEPDEAYIRIKSRWVPSNYINIESHNGSTSCGTILPGWWSAMWILEP